MTHAHPLFVTNDYTDIFISLSSRFCVAESVRSFTILTPLDIDEVEVDLWAYGIAVCGCGARLHLRNRKFGWLKKV